jgi:hypothetical protein
MDDLWPTLILVMNGLSKQVEAIPLSQKKIPDIP